MLLFKPSVLCNLMDDAINSLKDLQRPKMGFYSFLLKIWHQNIYKTQNFSLCQFIEETLYTSKLIQWLDKQVKSNFQGLKTVANYRMLLQNY